MITIKTILLVVPTSVSQNKLPANMNSNSWYEMGAIVAFLLLIYLFIALFKYEKF
jgi:K+-transporting ATPase KdpF subunit